MVLVFIDVKQNKYLAHTNKCSYLFLSLLNDIWIISPTRTKNEFCLLSLHHITYSIHIMNIYFFFYKKKIRYGYKYCLVKELNLI